MGEVEGVTTRVESHSLMAAPSASLLTSFFSPQKVLPASTSAPGWSMSLSARNWTSSSGRSLSSWCPPPSSLGPSSSIPEEFLSPPPQIFGSQLYGGGTSQQSDVNILSEHHPLNFDQEQFDVEMVFNWKVVITEEVDIKPVILRPPSPIGQSENTNGGGNNG